jgi:metal-responsive CopG/Arc/MetJ family transcriptional regulator
MQSCNPVGISIPRDILSKIDQERGDISRSRFVLRILQRTYVDTHTKANKIKKENLGDAKPVG